MILTIKPSSRIRGKVSLPASKSYSIRAFLISACGGKSCVVAPSDCDDAVVSMSAAKALGAKIRKKGRRTFIISADTKLTGAKKIRVGESGTVLRFLLPLVSLHAKKAVIVGEGTLKGRPNLHLVRSLRENGMDICGTGKKESVPIKFRGGELSGGKIAIEGSLSSQFVSALLITAPRLDRDTRLVIRGKRIVSSDYVAMTLQVLKKSGIKVSKVSSRDFRIKGKQTFKGLKKFTVPSDYGLAAFLMAAAALTDSRVVLEGYFDDRLIQADGAILPLLKKMGVKFFKTGRSIQIKGPFSLRGGDFSLKDCPDLVPIMSVLALFAKGKTRLFDIQHVRAKESDRISDLRKELLKIGAKVKETHNEIVIYPQKEYRKGIFLDPHNDHRLAMSFSVLGLRLGARVKNIECAAKSYPGFVRDLQKIGGKIKKTNRN